MPSAWCLPRKWRIRRWFTGETGLVEKHLSCGRERYWTASVLASRVPGNIVAYSEIDPRYPNGLITDHTDTVGIYARALVEGQFGIVPDALEGELLIRPGLPEAWEYASIDAPHVGYSYQREQQAERFSVRAAFGRPMKLRLRARARLDTRGSDYR